MNDTVFVDGFIAKAPHERAPDFVKASVSIKMKDLIEFAKQHHKDGWLNIDIKESRGGKYYAALNTWEPKKQEDPKDDFNDEIPF